MKSHQFRRQRFNFHWFFARLCSKMHKLQQRAILLHGRKKYKKKKPRPKISLAKYVGFNGHFQSRKTKAALFEDSFLGQERESPLQELSDENRGTWHTKCRLLWCTRAWCGKRHPQQCSMTRIFVLQGSGELTLTPHAGMEHARHSAPVRFAPLRTPG